MKLTRPTEDETLTAWDKLLVSIRRVECSLPNQMTAAMADLVAEARLFDDLLAGRQALDERGRGG